MAMNSLEKLFARFFADWLPGLPPGVKEWAARLFPWVLIILGGLGLLASLGAAGPAAAQNAGLGRLLPAAAVFFAVLVPSQQLLTFVAGCYMVRRRRIGWRLAFTALLLGLVVHLCWLSPAGLSGDIVCAYLLFQLKPYYRL